ncbi:hypothetical protein [Bradyrhizobium sp. S69]|uniref:hypothetical protein n=1 Tax=Bradyrhizobium sp. S69 TaxID=1641856 RepID=UPI001AED3D51|nr:hypothetical protein [Bradyrhizobium sp. S69]
MPMMTVPMAVMPAPVTVMPMVVAPMMTVPVVTVPMMAPADLLRLQLIDLGLRDQSGLRGLRLRSHDLHRRGRCQRRGIGHADKRRSARGHSDRQFQNRTKQHSIFSLHVMSQEGEVRCVEMNGL